MLLTKLDVDIKQKIMYLKFTDRSQLQRNYYLILISSVVINPKVLSN